ncbi:MAG TPA: hypothetical protein VKR58_04410 [Aquella sp.]|nr:hypothetical protein [Aquella sp.]
MEMDKHFVRLQQLGAGGKCGIDLMGMCGLTNLVAVDSRGNTKLQSK